MFICMIKDCNKEYNANDYIEHLRTFHRTPREYRYVCTFHECYQKAANFYIFKRHVLSHDVFPSTSYQEHHLCDETHLLPDTESGPKKKCDLQEINCSSSINVELEESTYALHLQEIRRSAVELTLQLHKETNLSRRDVQKIQHAVSKYNSQVVSQINNLLPSVSSNPEVEFELGGYLRRLQDPFDFIDSDHKFFKHLEQLNIFRFPIIIHIEKEQKFPEVKTNSDIEEKKIYTVMNDIEFQLRAYFSNQKVLQETINYTQKQEISSEFNNFVSAQLWKTIRQKYPVDILIPVALYSDEFEINDNLSAHNKKHCICGVYYNILTIPDQYKSKLCNILVAAMIKKSDIGELGINQLFSPIVQKFKDTEEQGMIFIIDGEKITIRFALVLVQGDNLGIHQMLQFLTFNANYYCRFCQRAREDCRKDVKEFPEYRRTVYGYNKDVAINRPPETGIKMETVFNQLPSFHAVANLCVDPMHDFYSGGICLTGLTKVLNYCIYSKKFISLNTFNAQKCIFSKVALDTSLKRMPDVNEIYMFQKKCKSVVLRATASEMKAFVHYIPLILGPYVPKGDPVWEYCKVLIKMSDKILLKSFSKNDIEELNELCKDHHTLYKQLFQEHLKPKHHFICHYGSVISTCGSVVGMMNFRNEAKHKGFKEYAHIISSRQNICYTLCIKSALQFAYDLHTKEFFNSPITGAFASCELKEKWYYEFLPQPNPINVHRDIQETKCLKYKGTDFKTGTYVTITNLLDVQILEIEDILKTTDNNCYLVVTAWNRGTFDEHYLAYVLIDKSKNMKMINLNEVDGPPVMPHNIHNKLCIRKKTDFLSMDL